MYILWYDIEDQTWNAWTLSTVHLEVIGHYNSRRNVLLLFTNIIIWILGG